MRPACVADYRAGGAAAPAQGALRLHRRRLLRRGDPGGQRRRLRGAEAAPAGAARRLQALDGDRAVRPEARPCRWSWRRWGWPACTPAAARRRRPARPRRPACRSASRRSASARSTRWRRRPQPPWFQLYMIRDRGFMAERAGAAPRAPAARCCVFTVDLPVPGARYRDARNGMIADTAAAAPRPGARRPRPPGLAVGRAAARPPAHARQRRRRGQGPEAPGRVLDLDRPQLRSLGHLERHRLGARALDGSDRAQGRARRRGRARGRALRRRRHRGLQPWRAPARRRALRRSRALPADRRGGGRRPDRADGRRRALGPRRAEGAGQRGQGLPDRPRLGLRAGRRAARPASPTCCRSCARSCGWRCRSPAAPM